MSKYIDGGTYVANNEIALDFDKLAKEKFAGIDFRDPEVLKIFFESLLESVNLKKLSPEYIAIKFDDISFGDILKTIFIKGHRTEILTLVDGSLIIFKIHRLDNNSKM